MSHPENLDPNSQEHGELGFIDPSNLKSIDATPVIPGYKVERLIDSGAMGKVYLATQEVLERLVAIKVITPSLSIDSTFRQRFLKEGKIIAQLRHPHIVTIHDIGECLNQYYMVMEYVEDGSLKGRIKKGLSVEQAVTVLRQIAGALGYAHRQGFLHRDVKPTNILFRSDGSAVLSDFGIAKALDDNAHLTATGLAVGTVLYMSPEQAQGEAVDGRSDLYSLGLMFFEMLVGSRPDRTLGGFIERLPPKFGRYQGIVDKLLARNPDERFATAEQLIGTLDKIDDQETDQTVLLPSKEIRKAKHRIDRYAIVGGGLLAVVMLLGLGYGLWWWHQSSNQPSNQLPNQPPNQPLNQSLSQVLPVQVFYSFRAPNQLNFQSLIDGGMLHSGDHYQIRFVPEQDGYVYIFQIDSSGAVYRLFPFEGADSAQSNNTNPVRAGVTYFVPDENEAFELDDQVGREQIHFLAFKGRDMKLENQYVALVEARQAQDHSRIGGLQLRLIDRLMKADMGVNSILNFKHNPRGSHEL